MCDSSVNAALFILTSSPACCSVVIFYYPVITVFAALKNLRLQSSRLMQLGKTCSVLNVLYTPVVLCNSAASHPVLFNHTSKHFTAISNKHASPLTIFIQGLVEMSHVSVNFGFYVSFLFFLRSLLCKALLPICEQLGLMVLKCGPFLCVMLSEQPYSAPARLSLAIYSTISL